MWPGAGSERHRIPNSHLRVLMLDHGPMRVNIRTRHKTQLPVARSKFIPHLAQTVYPHPSQRRRMSSSTAHRWSLATCVQSQCAVGRCVTPFCKIFQFECLKGATSIAYDAFLTVSSSNLASFLDRPKLRIVFSVRDLNSHFLDDIPATGERDLQASSAPDWSYRCPGNTVSAGKAARCGPC